jgi:hypothetical protein
MLLLRHIGGSAGGLDALGLERGGRRGQAVLVHVGQHHVESRGGESIGEGGSMPLAAPVTTAVCPALSFILCPPRVGVCAG